MLNFEKYQNIIFDFDETIATLDITWKEWHNGVGSIFRKFEPSFDKHLKGERVEFLQNYYFEKYGAELKNEVDAFTREYELNNTKRILPIDKTISLIKKLEGKRMFVWTSNDSQTAKRYLTELGILSKFELIIGHEMVDFIKPNPNGFEKYLKDVGTPESFLYIGNSSSDRKAAAACNITYLDVTEM